MEQQQRVSRLNGWMRLWIALAPIGLVPALYTITTEWESADDWIREMQLVPPNKINVEGVGVIAFPATMSPEAIALVTRDNAGKPDAIENAITAWVAEFNELIRAYVKDLNRSLLTRVAGYWVGSLALLYGIGLLLAWVRRGFRS